MLISCNILPGYQLKAIDGDFGTVTDLLFDDKHKIVRYFVIDCGNWLQKKEVLLSPVAFEAPDHDSFSISTILSRKAIEDSPCIETRPPVSKQAQNTLADYYDWPMFWSTIPHEHLQYSEGTEFIRNSHEDQLRSLNEIKGYSIQCDEGELGHIEELIVDTDSWTLRYVTIDTGRWLPGKKVIIGIDWLTRISWEEQKAYLDLSKTQVRNAPLYDPRTPVNREFEKEIYDYYGRPTYWKEAGTLSLYE
ncbi:MAG: PRC-barrel domain-containing protein [Planctomycetaceae bacterium]